MGVGRHREPEASGRGVNRDDGSAPLVAPHRSRPPPPSWGTVNSSFLVRSYLKTFSHGSEDPSRWLKWLCLSRLVVRSALRGSRSDKCLRRSHGPGTRDTHPSLVRVTCETIHNVICNRKRVFKIVYFIAVAVCFVLFPGSTPTLSNDVSLRSTRPPCSWAIPPHGGLRNGDALLESRAS